MLFSSTVINSGRAVGIVVYTGMNTAIGRVQAEVQEAAQEEEDTPLKKKLDAFGETLSKIIAIICFLVWIMNYNNFFDEMHGSAFKGCIYYFKIAIALAVAAIPEGLPAVITTCLALGTRKMAANNAIVRRLNSVETLGCTTVICSDKTGTLTKNEMCAVKLAYLQDSVSKLVTHDIEEKSYDPRGRIEGFEAAYKSSSLLFETALVYAVNNKAGLFFKEGRFQKLGEPTEAALKVAAEKIGQHDDRTKGKDFTKEPTPFSQFALSQLETIATLEFSSERKCMSTVVRGLGLNPSGGNSVLLKGAPEMVIDRCHSYKTITGEVK